MPLAGRMDQAMTALESGTRVAWNGYLATVVAYRPELGGYVLSMLGADEDGPDGNTPGEQWTAPATEVRPA